MSSTPHSPPETPLKPTMAVDNETLTPKRRPLDTPSKNGAKRTVDENPSKGVEQPKPGPEVYVPSTLSPDDNEDRPANQNVHQVEQACSDNISEAQTERVEEDTEVETEVTEPDNPNTELPPMDWVDFENRYSEAIQKANDEEDKLLAEFEKYAEAFRIWSLAPTQRDNDRGWKRLKTRQRYVQLAEAKLGEKKQHYEEVVLAFKKALELLRL